MKKVKLLSIIVFFFYIFTNIGCQEKIDFKNGNNNDYLFREKIKSESSKKVGLPKWEKEYHKAQKLLANKKYKNAIILYQKIIKKYPEDKRDEYCKNKYLLLQIGLCYEGLHQWEKAYQIYSELIEKYGLEEAKSRREFIDKYNLIKLEKKRKNRQISEGYYLAKTGYAFIYDAPTREKAFELLKKAVRLEPNNPEVLLRLGQAYNLEGDEILHHSDSDGKFTLKGRAYKDKALNIFKRIIKEYPNSEFADDAQYWLGEFYSDSNTVWDNDYKQAIREYEILIKKYPDSELIPMAYLKIGDCYRWLEDYHQAIKEYERVIKYFPTTQEAILAQRYIGMSYTALKDYKRAIEEHQKIIDRFPNSEDAGLSLLDIAGIYENLKDYTKAIEIYKIYIDNYAKREIDREIYKEIIESLKNKVENK